jgi:hypothetical protein
MPLLRFAFIVAAFVFAAAAAPTPPRYGPIQFGMTPEEARAALPEAMWQTSQRAPSGREIAVVSGPVLQLGGARATVEVLNRRYRRGLSLKARVGEPGEIDAAACLGAGKQWVVAIAEPLGAMSAPPPGARTDPNSTTYLTQRIEGNLLIYPLTTGGGTTTFGERLEIAPNVAVLLDAVRDARPVPLERWSRRAPTRFSLEGETASGRIAARVGGDYQFGVCDLYAELVEDDDPPQPETYVFAPEKLKAPPSLAARRLAARMAGPALTEPLTRNVTCNLGRTNGSAFTCGVDPVPTVPLSPEVGMALLTLAEGQRFDMTGVDPDEPVTMRVTMPVTLAPVPPLPPFAALEPRSLLMLTGGPSAGTLQSRIAGAAERAGLKSATLDIACRVEVDHSVFCDDVTGEPPEAVFVLEAPLLVLFAASLRAEPTLRDGRPSAGAAFLQPFEFRLQD